jgi:hypothetical protein
MLQHIIFDVAVYIFRCCSTCFPMLAVHIFHCCNTYLLILQCMFLNIALYIFFLMLQYLQADVALHIFSYILQYLELKCFRLFGRDENGTDIFRPYSRPNPFRGVLIRPYPSPDI